MKTDPATGERSYLGQMDVNIRSPLVWQYYEEVLDKLAALYRDPALYRRIQEGCARSAQEYSTDRVLELLVSQMA